MPSHLPSPPPTAMFRPSKSDVKSASPPCNVPDGTSFRVALCRGRSRRTKGSGDTRGRRKRPRPPARAPRPPTRSRGPAIGPPRGATASLLPRQLEGKPVRVEVAVGGVLPHHRTLDLPGLPTRADELAALREPVGPLRHSAAQKSKAARTADATNTPAARQARARSPSRSAERSRNPPKRTPPKATTNERGYTPSSKVVRQPSPSRKISTRAPSTKPSASPTARPPSMAPCRVPCDPLLTRWSRALTPLPKRTAQQGRTTAR